MVILQLIQSVSHLTTEITERVWHVACRLMLMHMSRGLVGFFGATSTYPSQCRHAHTHKQKSHHLYSGAGTSFMIRAITSSVDSPCVIKRTDNTGWATCATSQGVTKSRWFNIAHACAMACHCIIPLGLTPRSTAMSDRLASTRSIT